MAPEFCLPAWLKDPVCLAYLRPDVIWTCLYGRQIVWHHLLFCLAPPPCLPAWMVPLVHPPSRLSCLASNSRLCGLACQLSRAHLPACLASHCCSHTPLSLFSPAWLNGLLDLDCMRPLPAWLASPACSPLCVLACSPGCPHLPTYTSPLPAWPPCVFLPPWLCLPACIDSPDWTLLPICLVLLAGVTWKFRLPICVCLPVSLLPSLLVSMLAQIRLVSSACLRECLL